MSGTALPNKNAEPTTAQVVADSPSNSLTDNLAENLAANAADSLADSAAPSEASERVHYLDNLRAWAMLLGVLLHAGLAYAEPSQSVWLATDRYSSVMIDASIWLIHLFRMSLFYLLSGYFAKLVVQRKGWQRFMRQRLVRVVLPMILFFPFLWLAMGLVIVFGLTYVEQPRGLMGLIAAASRSESQSSSSGMPISTMHLWFLYYLVFFTLLSWPTARLIRCNWDWLFQGTWRANGALCLAPCLLVPGVLVSGVPLPAPESLVPSWWPFCFYGAFYWFGWQLVGRENFLDKLQSRLGILVLANSALFVIYYLIMPVLSLDSIDPEQINLNDLEMLLRQPWTPRYLLAAWLTAYLSVGLTIICLLVGKRFLSLKVTWMRWLADAAYWIYLVHLPLVLFFQTLFIPLEWPVWLKFALTTLLTLVLCLVSYVVLVRYTPIGWMLHGRKQFP